MGQRYRQYSCLPSKQTKRTKVMEQCFSEVKCSPCKTINTRFVTSLLKQHTLDCHAFVFRPALTAVSINMGQIATDTRHDGALRDSSMARVSVAETSQTAEASGIQLTPQSCLSPRGSQSRKVLPD